MSRTLLLLCVALATTAARFDQPPQGVFPSPMILTAKFVAIDELLRQKGQWFTTVEYLDLSKSVCDGVSLSGAVVEPSADSHGQEVIYPRMA